MEEIMKNTVEAQTTEEQLKQAVEEQLQKVRRQGLLIGSQTICRVMLGKISEALNRPGKRTMNDYKRIIKDIQKMCEVSLSRKINADGEIEEASDTDETVQN